MLVSLREEKAIGIFDKKCAICDDKLPDKREFTKVCNPCGWNLTTFSKQMEDTIKIIENAKQALTCYDRCLFGLALCDQLLPYKEKGFYKYIAGTHDDQRKYFINKGIEFGEQVREQNRKRKYTKKVGLPLLVHYKKLHQIGYQWAEGTCKGCWEPADLNDTGYCFSCILRATAAASQAEIADFKKTPEGATLEGDALANAATAFVLKKAKVENLA